MKRSQIVAGLLLAASVFITENTASAQLYTISTIAGIGQVQGWFGDTGPATNAQLDFPFRVAVDSKGNFYIADYLTHVIREVTSAGIISTIAGTGTYGFQGDNGPGVQAFLSDVHGLAVDSNLSVYIADTHNSRVRKVTSTGTISTFAGNGTFGYAGDGGLATSAAMMLPAGVAVDAAGNVYIADYGNSTVRKVDSKGNITTLAGTGVWGFSGDGGPANKASLAAPYSVAIDPAGNIYVSDLGNTNIRKITTDGNIHTIVSNISAGNIAVDSAGSIYFPDYFTATVQKIFPNGTQFTIAGTGTPGFSGDGGRAIGASLNQPYGIAVDASGKVYVADSQNQVIRLLTPVPSSISVVNGASGVGASIAPGEIVTIYGTGLGPSTPVLAQPGNNGNFGTELAGTTVSFGGTNGPVLYASDTQVSAIVPYATPIGGAVDVTLTYQDQQFTASAVPVISSAPGVFTSNSTGIGQAAAINQDNSINGPGSPARPGSIISMYLTGEGQTNPSGVDGKPATKPYPAPVLPIAVTIAGQAATVTYAGGAPGLVAGVMQLNVQVPASLGQNTGGSSGVPVLVIENGFTPSQPNVTITVAP
jgi:uncharacterized protein (TIGR03437 family)